MFGIGLLNEKEIDGLEQYLKELVDKDTTDTNSKEEIITDVIYEDSFFGSEIGKYG